MQSADWDALAKNRDELIRKALDEGYSERSVAEAVGLTPGRINQIKYGE